MPKTSIFDISFNLFGPEIGTQQVKFKVEEKKWSQNFDWRPCYQVIVIQSYFLFSKGAVLGGLTGVGVPLTPPSGLKWKLW